MDILSKYRDLPLEKLEELAYAVQISYTPPLAEKQRHRVLRAIKVLLTSPEPAEEEMLLRGRIYQAVNERTPIGYDVVLLKSEAQLVYLPDTDSQGRKVYYAFDKVVDVPEILRKGRNLSNMKYLTQNQVDFLEQALEENLYPKIATGDYFEEVRSRLGQISEPKALLYSRRLQRLTELFEKAGLSQEIDSAQPFAEKCSVEEYETFLRHRSLKQKLISTSRTDAAGEALKIILDYLEVKKQSFQELGEEALREMAAILKDFVTMIEKKWDYATLKKEIPESTWNPVRIYPDEVSSEFKAEGEVDSMGNRIGYWKWTYASSNTYMQGSYDEKGDKTGKWFKFYDNSIAMRSKGTYFEGKRSGQPTEEGPSPALWIKWYSNGKKDYKGEYLNGKRIGLWKEWYDDGTLESVGNYSEGKQTGLWKEYWQDGDLSGEGEYFNGMRTGKWKEMDEDENIHEGEYLNGEKVGLWIKCDNRKTRLLKRKHYSEGLLSGPYESFYPKNPRLYSRGGQGDLIEDKKEVGEYLMGLKVGKWTTFHNNNDSSIESISRYRDGELHGLYVKFCPHKANCVIEEGNYENGRRVGLWEEKHGKVFSQGEYAKGLKSGLWTSTWLSNKGKLASKGEYVQGKREGEWQFWNKSNTGFTKGSYLNDEKDGPWVTHEVWRKNRKV